MRTYMNKKNYTRKKAKKKNVLKMENKKQQEESKRPMQSLNRSQSPKNRTPYDRHTSNENKNDLQAIENSIQKSLNEEELAFKLILDEFKIKLDKLNFDLIIVNQLLKNIISNYEEKYSWPKN
jgi:hypothetical protein